MHTNKRAARSGRINVRVAAGTERLLKEEAARRGLDVSDIVREIITERYERRNEHHAVEGEYRRHPSGVSAKSAGTVARA